MFTTGSKWYFGLGVATLVLAVAYGWATGGTNLGPVTAGYKGGVGDHFGYTLLLGVAAVGIFLGLVAVALRDANPSALAQVAGTDEVPAAVPPAHLSYWPIAGAFGVGLVVLGLVVSNVLFVIGFIVLLAVLAEWMVLAWSDRATGDPETNRVVRERLIGPYEVPLAGVLLAGGTVAALSRVLLTASKLGAVGVGTVAATVIFLLGILFATRPKISPNTIAGILVVVAAGIVTAGVVSAARGERTIHEHEEPAVEQIPGGGEGQPGNETGNHPLVPQGTEHSTSTTTTEAQG